MAAAGIFDNERVELLEGVVVTLSPIGPPHASIIELLSERLIPALLGRARARVQLPWVAADDSEPQPDLAVVPIGDHSGDHPLKAHLLIEVADSSLRKDRLVKAPLYARAGVGEYWIFDVQGKAVEVHRHASSEGWRSVTRHSASDTLSLLAFPDVTVALGGLLR
jgi:Uma2 family endonuclease